MIRYVTLETEGPMSLTFGRSAGFETETLHFIPGTTFRGAVANAYLENGGLVSDAAFVRCFIDEKVRFTDLRPVNAFPWPNSVVQCAEHPLGKEPTHALMDLLPRAARDESLLVKCPECDAKFEGIKGFAELQLERPYEPRYQVVTVHTERRMHSEINPKTLSVKATKFHSANAVCVGQFFSGAIIAAEGFESALDSIWENVKEGLFIGRGRSRGQGRVKFVRRNRGGSQPSILERLRDCNVVEGAVSFTCDFHSVSLFYDDWLCSKTGIEGGDLDDGLSEYKRQATFVKTSKRGGWHAAAQLPRPEITVLEAGSCFLFRRVLSVGETIEGETARIAPLLAKLERDGCGERLAEGFGEVTFCHDIHASNGEAQ